MLPAGVQVTTHRATARQGRAHHVHVRVVGPRDRADELVANLEHSRRFLQPRIVGENAESSNGPDQRLEPSAPRTASTSICWPTTIRPRPRSAAAPGPGNGDGEEAGAIPRAL